MPKPQDVIDMEENASNREYVLKQVARKRFFVRVCISRFEEW